MRLRRRMQVPARARPGRRRRRRRPAVSAMDGRRGAARFGRRHHARNRNKAGDFRRWLVATFGFETLAPGAGSWTWRGARASSRSSCNLSGIGDRGGPSADAAGTIRATVQVGDTTGTIARGDEAAQAPRFNPRRPDHLRMFLHRGVFDPARSDGERRLAAIESELAHATRWSRRGSWTGSRHPGTGTGSRHPATGFGTARTSTRRTGYPRARATAVFSGRVAAMADVMTWK